jgi:hypothetical protein
MKLGRTPKVEMPPPELVAALLAADETGRIVILPGPTEERDSFLSLLDSLKFRGLVTRETVDLRYSPHWLTDTGQRLHDSICKARGLEIKPKAKVESVPADVKEATTITCLCGNKITRDRSWFRTNRESQCPQCRAKHVIEDFKNAIEDSEQLTHAIENFRKKLSRPLINPGAKYAPAAK